MSTQGIYVIRNTTNGRCYVGSSFNIERRFNAHRHMLKHGKHHSPSLQRSWDKHGSTAFVFQILEIVENIDDLLVTEQKHIYALNAADSELGYNVSPISGTRRGVPQPESMKLKLSAERKGVPKSEETKRKMSEASKGRPKSAETIAKISEAAKKQFSDPAQRIRQSEIRTGTKLSQETKDKISKKLIGREVSQKSRDVTAERNRNMIWTDEMKAKISVANSGKNPSEETRLKMSMAHKGKKRIASDKFKHSDEWKINHSEKLKGRPRVDHRTPSNEEIQRMKELRLTGLSYAKIAKEVDRDIATVWKYTKI